MEYELLILPEHPSLPPVLSGVHVAISVFCVVFCRSSFFFFFGSLYCLSFDLRLSITPLIFDIFIFFNLIGALNIFVIFSHSPILQRLTIILLVGQEFQAFVFNINIRAKL